MISGGTIRELHNALKEMMWYLWASSETRKISLGRDNVPRTAFPACRLASQLLPEFLCCQPQVVPQVNPKVPRGEPPCLANHTHQPQSHSCSVLVLWVNRSAPNPRPAPMKALLCTSCLILPLPIPYMATVMPQHSEAFQCCWYWDNKVGSSSDWCPPWSHITGDHNSYR